MWRVVSGFISSIIGWIGVYISGYRNGKAHEKAKTAKENIELLVSKNKRLSNRPRTVRDVVDRLQHWIDNNPKGGDGRE